MLRAIARGVPLQYLGVGQLTGRLLNLSTHAQETPRMSQTRVVIVDDDPGAIELHRRVLANAGYVVDATMEANQVEGLIKLNEPTILLTDWNMPNQNGAELCRRIRAHAQLEHVYIIVLTGCSTPETVREALDAGANDFVVKSHNRDELLARVRAAERVVQLWRKQRDLMVQLEETNRERERAVRKAHDAIEQLNQAQAHLLAADKLASIGQLAAGIAHEINNPIGYVSSNLNTLHEYAQTLVRLLTSMRELVEVARADAPGLIERAEEIARAFDQSDTEFIITDLDNLIGESLEGTRRVRQIVLDLKDFSHIDSPDVREENVNDILDKTINVAWNELKYKTKVIKEYGDIPEMPCYGGKLGQVFLNLLVNAAQAIEQYGTITIRTGRDGEIIWIEIADTGCGISEKNLSRLFDPFFTTKDVGKGTGLGLHLANNIVKAHNGRITVESTVGVGSTFRVELPLAGPMTDREPKHDSVAC
jgi:two-component system, NtrC family, sensor kinase